MLLFRCHIPFNWKTILQPPKEKWNRAVQTKGKKNKVRVKLGQHRVLNFSAWVRKLIQTFFLRNNYLAHYTVSKLYWDNISNKELSNFAMQESQSTLRKWPNIWENFSQFLTGNQNRTEKMINVTVALKARCSKGLARWKGAFRGGSGGGNP